MTRKTNNAAARRQTAAHVATLHTPGPLDEAQQTYLDLFQPLLIDEQHRITGRAAVQAVMSRCGHVRSMSTFIKCCSDVSALVAWAITFKRSLHWQHLMDHAVIEEFSRQSAHGGNTNSRSQRMRRLKSLASAINPGPTAPPRAPATPYRAIQPPYTAAEMAALRRWAHTQPSPRLRQQLCVLVGLARGAGVGANEFRPLTTRHVDNRGADGVFVTLGHDESLRTIPVRRAWEGTVLAGLEGVRPGDLLIGKDVNRRNIGHSVFERAAVLGTDTPKPDIARMRTTWLAELMGQPIPLNVLLDAAGLTTARTLAELLPLLTVDAATASALVRGEAS